MNLTLSGNIYKLDKGFLEKVAKAAFSYLGQSKTEGEIGLKFVSSQYIQKLNMEYRKVNAPTDVLSFNISDKPLLGQVFICYTYTGKQAIRASKSLQDEVALLLIHGILHIFGYDHASLSDEKKMQFIEKEILEGFNIKR